MEFIIYFWGSEKNETIEEWREFFEKIGLKVVASEFIRENFSNPNLFPKKAIIIFQKRRKS